MDGYARTEDELFSSCLLNLTWDNCYEQPCKENVLKARSDCCGKTRLVAWEFHYITVCLEKLLGFMGRKNLYVEHA